MRCLLDTHVLSQLLRDPHGDVAHRLGQHTEADVFTSVVVACELRYGALKKNSAPLTQRVEQLLGSLDVATLGAGVEEAYASIRTDLESRGLPIGANDLLIAAHALTENATLVTDNTEEFRRVHGLVVENWIRPT